MRINVFKRLYDFELKHNAFLRMMFSIHKSFSTKLMLFIYLKVYLRVCQNINLNYVIALKHTIRYSIIYFLIAFSLLLSSTYSLNLIDIS